MIKRPIIAICYDFDGTLSPGNMQEYEYIPKLRLKPKAFWEKAKKLRRQQDADEIIAYMNVMLEQANRENEVEIKKENFIQYGKKVKLFRGVTGWFKRINKYGSYKGAKIEHFIISSGIKEMIMGSKIAGCFKKIYASSFIYDQNGVAKWPGMAINYTTKTQFLFRINKGAFNLADDKKVNKHVPKEKRPVPFDRIIYIGDGTSDIPCMSLVKEQGGYSIAVYRPHSRMNQSKLLKKECRVNYIAPADYRLDSKIDKQVKCVINKIMADYKVKLASY